MNLSNVSNIRFNGSDVKLAKIDGVIIYRKDEEDVLLIARYTANASGVLPIFNNAFEGYSTIETDNNDGTYTVRITTDSIDNLPTSISFEYKTNLLTVEYSNVDKVNTMRYMFYGCTNLTSLDVSNWDTSRVTTMLAAFSNCTNLTSLDVSNWDIGNVTVMNYMFTGCTNLASLDVSNWDTSKVTNMYAAFQNCNKLTSLDVSNWDTSRVTNMTYMFTGCTNLTSLDVSNWDTSKVTTMVGIFNNCNKLTSLDLSNWDISKVTDMSRMFTGCNKLTSLNSMKNITTDLSLPASLNEESVLDVIDNLATVTTTKTLNVSAAQLSWISEDKIAEANNKGWTISV